MTDSTEEIKDPAGLLAAYNKAKEDLVALRDAKKELEAQVATLTEASADDKWRKRALQESIKSALEAEGIKGGDRVLRLMDLTDVDFDDEDNLTGFAGKVDAVKKDYPELFDPKVRTGGKADIHANGEPVKVNPLKQQIHAALTA